MDAATLERIFEPFFSTKLASEGAGLGLASVYGIIKQSGGHIDVASEPGRGTTFTIYFPRHEGSEPVGAGTGGRDAVGGEETILLVEDEEQVRELARRVLERVGYTVLAAADAESAIALADRHAGHIHLLVDRHDAAAPGRPRGGRPAQHPSAGDQGALHLRHERRLHRPPPADRAGDRLPREAVLARSAPADGAPGPRTTPTAAGRPA